MLYSKIAMEKWKDFKKELMKDPEVRKEYDALRPQYELAAQIIEARLKKGLSQSQLAEKIGTKQSAIARLESGDYNPSVGFLEKVADATGTRLKIQLNS